MRRVAILISFFLGAELQAQSGYRLQVFYDLPDSVAAALEGDTVGLELLTYDFWGSGVDSFALEIRFDSTKLEVVRVTKLCPAIVPPLNYSLDGGSLVLSTSQCDGYYYYEPIVRLTLRLRGGVTNGTMVNLLARALRDNSNRDRLADFTGDFAEICHASKLWGDVDENRKVTSRDALVALSSAVGIPASGFDLSVADVDADGAVTSRDALLMLTAAIGIPTTSFRVGRGIPDRCAPQVVLPRTFYFSRGGASPGDVTYGSGLSLRPAQDSAFTVVGDSADANLGYQWRPRVSPDGGSVLFVCLNSSFYPNICKANADGSGPVRLTSGLFIDNSPDWSPDGAQIVFVRNGQLYTMNSDGSSLAVVPSSPSGVTSVSWQPVAGSRRVAYTIPNYGTTSGVRMRSLDTATTDSAVVATPSCCALYDARMVDWSPDGDSLTFEIIWNNYRVVAVAPARAAVTPQLRMASPFGVVRHPAWTDQGIFFVTYRTGLSRMFLLKSDLTVAPIGRDTRDNFAPGMVRK